jgi:hypothetical protein
MGVVMLEVDGLEDATLDMWGLKHLESLEGNPQHWRDAILKVNGLSTLKNFIYPRWDNVALTAYTVKLGWLKNLQGATCGVGGY